ncbi:vWA domain-containing protein [Rubritalea marina]|uniref:vWA domain-containing protein n=1 Tax=Rubritalea marina TaxID=361055 RepID=UPI000376E461|nr:VWA domain-containing protein [Rubritalea marina]
MSISAPWFLILTPLFWFLLRRKRKRSALTVASTQQWGHADHGKAKYLWIPVAMRHASIFLFIIALSRPQTQSNFSQDVNEGIAIQLLVDVSSSMDMRAYRHDGTTITRMELAKEMVETFIEGDGEELAGRPNDLIGLITFARYADTRSPLTFGHQALLQIVRSLDIQERPNEDGTAYGDALAIAAARLQKLEELKHQQSDDELNAITSKVIILLTDGENNSGAHLPLEAAGLAKSWACKIYCISLGDHQETTPTLNAAEQTLEHISTATGGIFRQAHDLASLRAVYAEIDQLETAQMTTRDHERISELFWIPLSLGLLSLTLALVLEATILRVVP